MPINTVCPECRSSYLLADQQAGKKVRCKKCQTVFVAGEASGRRPAARDEGVKPASGATARRGAPPRKAREDDDAWDEPRGASSKGAETKKPRSALPWILGGAGVLAGLLLLVCGGLLGAFLMRDKPTSVANNTLPPNAQIPPQVELQPPPNVPINPAPVNRQSQPELPPIQGQPVPQATNPPPVKADNPPPPAVEDKQPKPAAANNGRLTGTARDRVKHATVFLRVTMADGKQASGTGFFGCKEARNIVLTNAHVVGMLAPESGRPQAIEVVVHSGQSDEWKTSARVLGVDRSSDLAVLDIGTPPKPVPEPLPVKSATGLQELDLVYVAGFPLGYALGKEITIRDASVSSLRQKNGMLDRLQINGGMDPGNSGGPVVDNTGSVIGVAVSGIEGRQINFAIPGDRVHTILEGRIADLTLHQPYFTAGDKVVLPVAMNMIDPRNLIKEVGLEVWTGDKPAEAKLGIRPPSQTQPPAQAGDSPHEYYKLKYQAPEGKGPIALPSLPPGKVYWRQSKWINGKGEPRWGAAHVIPTLQPVYHRKADLVLRYARGSQRMLDLDIQNILKLNGNDDDSEAFRIRTTAAFTETVVSSGSNGTVLSLRYRQAPNRETILPDGQSRPSGSFEQIRDSLPRLVTNVRLDRLGNILQQALDQRQLLALAQSNPQHLKRLTDFHEMIEQGLESLSVSLPPGGAVEPGNSWQAERHLPIDTPGEAESGKLEVTFTYLGTRKRDGREEAVISMDGLVRGKGDAVSGKSSGQILVDLASGQTLFAETTTKLQLEALVSEPGKPPHRLRVLAIMKFQMQRKL